MKKIIIITGVYSLLFTACYNTKLAVYNDDVYISPKSERLERQRLAAEKKKQEAEEARKAQEAQAAQKAKDDANPYYKDPEYSKDDYYDYQYASRMRRFNNPVNGLAYYDNYYTNSYWYNNNPASYGTSIYSSYNMWNNGCSCNSGGLSLGLGYNNSPYWSNSYYGNSWNNYNYSGSYLAGYFNGFNHGYYNGWNGYPYGYNNGYNYYGNYYGNNGWGYYNSYDVNSGYSRAPRGSHDGGNGVRGSNPVAKEGSSYVSKYFEAVQNNQDNTPKFEQRTLSTLKSGSHLMSADANNSNPVYYNQGNLNNGQGNGYNNGSSNPRYNVGSGGVNDTQTPSIVNFPSSNGNSNHNNPKNNATNSSVSQPVKINENRGNSNKGSIFDSGTINFGGGNSSSSPSSPRGGGSSGGGSGRPR